MLRYLPNHSQGQNSVFQLLVHGGGCVLSRVRLFVIPWNVAHQAPLSTEFSRQEYGSGLLFPSPGGVFPTQGLNLGLPHCSQTLLIELPEKQNFTKKLTNIPDIVKQS